MSWSISTILNHEHNAAGFGKDFDALNALSTENIGNQQAPVERDNQVKSAIGAVIEILTNSNTFKNAEELSVSMSGHANPDNQSDGGANDYIQVSMFVKKYRQA